MTPEERKSAEAGAERHLRRGELTEAFAAFQALLAEFPEDAQLATRVAQLQESLQPAELANPRSNFRSSDSGPPASPTATAESLASRGEFAEAIAIYRRLVDERPDSQLLQERLHELFRLVEAQAPRQAPAAPDRHALLTRLLERVAARRRRP